MSLSPGKSLGHYTIRARLGAGAMGEVWRATDTRLGRDVAIKVLPPRFAEDAERLGRFEREARSIASLNHSWVAQIYDVDQVDDVVFLVLELVPGEELAARIQRGPLPVSEAMEICARIAEGLEAAHEAGVVHRDLKPANVHVDADGQVKILDFGLAKIVRSGDESGASESSTDSVLSTEAGRLLGTPTYMAPEQARGRTVDRRVDVWAFGCVLYECLTGVRAFGGASLSDVVAAVLEKEPDWTVLPELPPRIEELLRRCLVKDPRMRLRDIGEARILLDAGGDGAASGFAPNGAGAPRSRSSRAPLVGILCAALGLALVLLAWQILKGSPGTATPSGTRPSADTPLHVSIEPPLGARILFSGDLSGPPVLSPDGLAVAFCAVRDGEPRRIWVRRLDDPEAKQLAGTEDALFPFWSAYGREVAFFANGRLRRYDLASDTIVDVVDVGAARGGCWTDDNRILYARSFRGGLSIVDANGGEPRPLTTLDEALHTSHRWPFFVTGTSKFFFNAVTATVGDEENNAIYLGDVDSNAAPLRLMASDYSAAWHDGRLLHVRDGVLLATPVDLTSGEVTGKSTPIARGIASDLSTWHGQFSISRNGSLVLYRPTDGDSLHRVASYSWTVEGDRYVYLTHDGREVSSNTTGMPMYSLALSPDGRMLAMDVLADDGYTDIWLFPTAWQAADEDTEMIERTAARGIEAQRLTFLPGPEFLPVWSPDASEVVFRWDGDDTRPRGIYRKKVGGGNEILVRDNQGADDHASDWTRDGRHLVVTTDTILPSADNDIIAVPLDGGRDLPLVTKDGPQYGGRVSPDGRWLAYVDASTRPMVYVIPFAPAWDAKDRGRIWLVSEEGGDEPRWSREGDELFFVTDTGLLFATQIDASSDTFTYTKPRPLFASPWSVRRRGYDPTPDHEGSPNGFMFMGSAEAREAPISLLLNWPALVDGE